MLTFRLLLVACLVSSPQLVAAQGVISLDKLSNCSAINTMRAALEHPISGDCRTARDQIESTVLSQYSTNLKVRTCLMATLPTSRFGGFSCIDLEYRGTREISCFRAIYKSAVTSYINGDESGRDTRAVKYANEISGCSFPNSNATPAPESVFPTIFRVIGKPRFGFALTIGQSRNVLAYHGFADLDPAVDSRGLGALEVFDIFKTDSSPISGVETPSVSDGQRITIEVNDFLDRRGEIEDNLRRQFRQPAIAKMRLLELKYVGSRDVPIERRRSDVGIWLKGIASILKKAGFREPTQSELAGMHISSADDLRDMVVRNSPFGSRDSVKHLLSSFVFLVDDEFDPCVQVAEVTLKEPEDEVREDYGSFAILLLGLGDCYRAQSSSATLSDALLATATRYLRNEVNKR